ncbi:MAG: hypothetical protein PF481_10575 [Bacteroidales bacterium]|nr:hypothetical protein [Bacteroidales bacterium]
MRKRIVILTGILGIIFSGCDKQNENISPSDSKDSTQIETHSLLINKNGVNYIEYLYTDTTVISYTDYTSGEYTEYNFANDSVVVNTYNENDVLKTKEVYHYNADKQIEYVNSYTGENSVFVEKKEYEYQEQILTKIDAYIPEIFSFQDENVQEYETVSEAGVMTTYKYEYNNKQNAFFMINLPETNVEYLSDNAIILKTAEWSEYIDNMGINDSTINHFDTIYTSTFEYDFEGLISREYRNLSDGIDTLEYFYSTETEWIEN